MSDIEFFILVVLFVAVFIALFYLWLRVVDNDKDIECLRKSVSNKISEPIFNFERDLRRGVQNELEAIKEYLNVEAVEPESKVKMRSKK